MSLLQRVEAIFANYLGEKDEHAVISAAMYPPVERFDAAASSGDSKSPCAVTWAKMDLSHVFGFPTWEEGVYSAFSKSYDEIVSIFNMYAKSGTAGASSASKAMTMQQTELQNLALDCSLSNEKFSKTRVINIFKRADQVDATAKASAADKRVMVGDNAKGGDRGLELHEFCECLVMLAFQKANPKFGEVGHNTEAAVSQPLPGCLETMIKQSLLTKRRLEGQRSTGLHRGR